MHLISRKYAVFFLCWLRAILRSYGLLAELLEAEKKIELPQKLTPTEFAPDLINIIQKEGTPEIKTLARLVGLNLDYTKETHAAQTTSQHGNHAELKADSQQGNHATLTADSQQGNHAELGANSQKENHAELEANSQQGNHAKKIGAPIRFMESLEAYENPQIINAFFQLDARMQSQDVHLRERARIRLRKSLSEFFEFFGPDAVERLFRFPPLVVPVPVKFAKQPWLSFPFIQKKGSGLDSAEEVAHLVPLTEKPLKEFKVKPNPHNELQSQLGTERRLSRLARNYLERTPRSRFDMIYQDLLREAGARFDKGMVSEDLLDSFIRLARIAQINQSIITRAMKIIKVQTSILQKNAEGHLSFGEIQAMFPERSFAKEFKNRKMLPPSRDTRRASFARRQEENRRARSNIRLRVDEKKAAENRLEFLDSFLSGLLPTNELKEIFHQKIMKALE